jgi:hypothetical protein
MRSQDDLQSLLARLSPEDRVWMVAQLSPTERSRLTEVLSGSAEEMVDPERVSFLARMLSQEPAWLQQAALTSIPAARRAAVIRALVAVGGGAAAYSDRMLPDVQLPPIWQELFDDFLGGSSQAQQRSVAESATMPAAHSRSRFERLVERFRGRGE